MIETNEENLKSTSEFPTSIFKDGRLRSVQFFLNQHKEILMEDFIILAQTISIDSEILFEVYHNLFQFNGERTVV